MQQRKQNELKERKNMFFGHNIDFLTIWRLFCDDVSMTSLVGSRSDDVMLTSSGDVAGSGWYTVAETWQDRWTNGRARGVDGAAYLGDGALTCLLT